MSEAERTLTPRLSWAKVMPKAYQAMRDLQESAASAGLPEGLLELVKVRASQLNGCAFCLDMHTKDARAAGESEQRLYALAAWRETPFFTPAERVALAWTEAVTKIENGVSDSLYDEVRRFYSEAETVALTTAIIVINAWNRWAIALRPQIAGAYHRPGS